jgi:predicted ATPase
MASPIPDNWRGIEETFETTNLSIDFGAMKTCHCNEPHERRRIVLTGGPGAGKTAILELIRQSFCKHVTVLPESAGIIFGGGFPRRNGIELRKAAQRAIFYVQRELETGGEGANPAIVLCDRATVDGAAYWPDDREGLFSSVGTTLDDQLRRYHAVIHLRTPSAAAGYNHSNPLRVETAEEAAEIDERIARIWETHPRRFVVEASADFLTKATRALEVLRGEMPECCRPCVTPLLELYQQETTGVRVHPPHA